MHYRMMILLKNKNIFMILIYENNKNFIFVESELFICVS